MSQLHNLVSLLLKIPRCSLLEQLFHQLPAHMHFRVYEPGNASMLLPRPALRKSSKGAELGVVNSGEFQTLPKWSFLAVATILVLNFCIGLRK